MGATLTLVGVALAGCSAAPSPTPTGLAVSVVQQRGDIAPGRVQLRLTNGSDTSLTLTSARLDSAALSAPASWDPRRAETLRPGQILDLPVVLPPVRCDSGDASARVTLGFSIDGDSRHAEIDADDPLAVLSRLSATQCDRDALDAVAHVEATAVTPRGNGTAALTVSIAPARRTDATDSSVELVALRGTPLLRFADGEESALRRTVSRGDAPSTADVSVIPRRCDPHAIAEDKVGTLFDLVARVDGREVTVPLERPQSVVDDLLAFTAAACGLTP